ncbi:helix-turn-helix domain-containing protein [Pseudomonas sp. CCI3.2]|uniref:helix-turn-helix transcriptional regulator n=1 Tax=unclassified Pseudomonas TaxID=196821 RepID=UPI002AC8FE60|nr:MULTISPECIES: helix-turn-helix domain-containing protein [unclassified Pseudomonas]MEB0078280.1 helix-turn-helix domain-containing protein [Pseudomonas sp. MH10out]MEB0101734.1 helix-turn-helix domain-containing protein [Pseudomonas sp. CCI3.2]MEB0160080.1 helix-turn-helix domain-containing protein [Pseudomonas sp. AH2 (2023)]MEB0168017.1 helix-turn-helix domain-containing protein [Pseudomonas sp. CCC4.4]WPX28849.1 helix-turn-helix domain-containing protein [Pseudomonas sp. AH2]
MQTINPATRIHRIQQVAAALNISRATVYRLIDAGELRRVKISVRAAGITDESLESFMTRRQVVGC